MQPNPIENVVHSSSIIAAAGRWRLYEGPPLVSASSARSGFGPNASERQEQALNLPVFFRTWFLVLRTIEAEYCVPSRFSCIFPTTHAHFLRPFCGMRRALAEQCRAGNPAPRSRRKLHLRRTSPHGGIRRPWIAENGFARGSRLAILADNHPRWVAAYLGIIASGCAVVPLDTALHDDQVTKLLKDSGASVVFCDVKHVPVARPPQRSNSS